MKAIKLILLSGLLSNLLYSQQVPLYSAYYLNPYAYNPAMAGYDGNINAFLTHSIQWSGFQGGPVTSVLTIDGPIKEKNIGIGLTMLSDITDISRRLGAYGSYAYRLRLNDNNGIFFGFSLGILDHKVDFSKVFVSDYSDPLLLNQDQRKTVADAVFGISYLWKDLQVGIAIPQLFANTIQFSDNNSRGYYSLSRHVLASLSYLFRVSKENHLSVQPLLLFRMTKGAPVQYDINVVGAWKETVWLNLNYKSEYAVGATLAVKVYNQLKVGYGYDFITSLVGSYAGISNQIMLAYSLGGKVKDSIAVKLKRVEELEKKIQLTEEQNNQLKQQITDLLKEMELTRAELKKAQSESTKSKTDSDENINALKQRLQALEDKLKLIISMMGE